MTDRKLLQEALDALEFPHDSEWSNKAKAIEALQHALAQPEQPDLRKAAEMALDALKISTPVYSPHKFTQALKALEAALAQPEKEPDCGEAGHDEGRCGNFHCITKPAPPKPEQEELIQFKDGKWSYVRKPWVGLTGIEVRRLKDIHIPIYSIPILDDYLNFYRAIENELKDKNTT